MFKGTSQKGSSRRIVLTGGHAATTAIAVSEELLSRYGREKIEIYWLGGKIAIEGKKVPTLESEALPKIGVKFYPLITGRLQTKFTRHTIPSLLRIPLGFIHAAILLTQIRPEVVVSFGGYASFPVVFWAFAFRIPVVLHEQTSSVGRANKLSSYFADKIALARATSQDFFKGRKTFVVGNPVMKEILNVLPPKKLGEPPCVLVMGGSRGSNFINSLVFEALPEILKKFRVLHITGVVDFEDVRMKKEKLPKSLNKNYEIFASADPFEITKFYRASDFVISRAGANTVSEILIVKRPAILIPLHISFNNEQLENAKFAKRFGIAQILTARQASAQKLIQMLDSLRKNWERIVTRVYEKKSPDREAAGKLVDLLEEYL